MKVNMVKTSGGFLVPADEEAKEFCDKIKNDKVYSCDIKVNQNYKLHKKMFAFFKFCAQHYYGDTEVTADQVEFTRKKLIMSAGYVKQIFYPDGVRFELEPMSLKYEKMTPEERQECYKKIVTSATKRVFHSADDGIYERLMSFF